MTNVREKLMEIGRRWTSVPDTLADAILAAHPELTPPSGSEAVEAARRIVAARGIDWKMPEGDWIEKDGYICARYILSLAPGKDVVEGAREIAAQNAKYAWAVPGGFALDRKWLERAITALTTACVAREREACAKIAEGRRLNEQGGVWCDEDRYRVQEGEAIAECIRAGGSK